MIGILKALGLRNGSVSRVFIWMSVYLISFGLAIGNLVGWALCASQKKWGWLKLDPEAYFWIRFLCF
jgi:lipoprotein-releasing system permease protein